MLNLCKYKDILGVPSQGFHSKRFLGMALGDILGTIGLAVLFSYFLNKSFLWVLLIVFGLGELLHVVFCVPTTFIKVFKK